MGKCLSCCEESDSPTQNGHKMGSSQSKRTASHSMSTGPMTKYRSDPTPIPGSMSSSASTDIVGIYSRSQSGSGDKKIFGQYPKLPPIRKPSNGAEHHGGKRTSVSSRDCSENKIYNLFEQYRDSEEDSILAEGIEKLCSDLEVRPEEFRVLVLAWEFDAETMCKFTRSEFANGCKKLHVDSIRGIQANFPEMLEEVTNKERFRDLYRWTYKFGLDTEIGQRTLPVDMAVSLWRLVYTQNEPPILPRWLDFLEGHPSVRGIPKDTWDMFLNFADIVGNDLSIYDDTEAWPSLFDDFVEYENDRQNQNLVTEKLLSGYE